MNNLVPNIRLRNARAWAPATPLRWVAAILAFVIALGIRFALHPVLGSQYALLFFAVATVVVHFFFGLGPALMIAVASLPVGTYFFIPPFNSFDIPTNDDLIEGGLYIVATAVYMLLIQYLRRAQYQAVLLAEIAESRYLMLLDSEADRVRFEAELQKRDI